ncbi:MULTISPECIES: thioredoxin family protein [Legionella]|uniref:Thioredoxin family protein n=1 Tax=Legionella septentrionalis TaxID=2498109 RepID=A0A3S0V9T3_9GAMM|nr:MULTISPECIES: thioredoxin family protein [Legionella]MCP0913264.1 thioredoxin family protein [Legionella sp. 27cVA30]RUQ82080.1 thioredoxin family protein [Legionella septentrionalis]RUQ95541.1 thioredoxin family protein [Legionella septentrionalis]RUR08940.1 thioredoxin family protein [Legionella septentrionalis]RUR14725.1 thioredoxin family protein [Legionella septentrionalis]
MARTESSMLPLGTQAPLFSLLDVTSGQKINLNVDSKYIATVVMFICNHCPFVKHVNQQLTKLAFDYIPKQVKFIAINSNDVESYPDDSPENMQRVAKEQGYPFPYLFDETQEVAKAYHAACTPDFFVFDADLSLVYRGQLDDSRPGNGVAVDGHSIRKALDALIEGKSVSAEQKPSIGCNIKWKS